MRWLSDLEEEIELCIGAASANSFYVDLQEGHDDFLVSLALVVQAAKGFSSREAKGWLRES